MRKFTQMSLHDLRALSWRDFCEGLYTDAPAPLQRQAEEYFFTHIASDALAAFFEKRDEILQLFELSMYAPQMRQLALEKTRELFKEDIPFFEATHPVIARAGLTPETANFLLVCAYLKKQ